MLIVALDPVLVVQGRAAMTETMAAMLLALGLAGLADGRLSGCVLGGALFGLLGLCRPSLLPGVALVGFGASMVPDQVAWSRRLLRLVLLGASCALVMSPWVIRNQIVLGSPILASTHGGFTLAMANDPRYYAEVVEGPADAIWAGPSLQAWFERAERLTQGLSEPEADAKLRRIAWEAIRAEPVGFVRAAWYKLGRFWAIRPSSTVYPQMICLVVAAWTVPLWILLVVGLLERRWWSWPGLAAPLLILALSLVHAVYWTDLRMRAPIVPAIALIAGSGLRRIWDLVESRRIGRSEPMGPRS